MPRQFTPSFQQIASTVMLLLSLPLFTPQLAQGSSTITTSLRVPIRDTLFLANITRPEWITVTGFVQATTRVVIPGEPCIPGDPCRNLNVIVRTNFTNARAVGQTTGRVFQIVGAAIYDTTISVPGHLAVPLDYTVISRGISIPGNQPLTLSMDVTTRGTATAAAVEPNLVGWWRADGNTADAAGGNPGTIAGNVVFAPGKVGQAFHFDGESSLVEIPASSALEQPILTTMLWMRSTLPQPGTYLLSKGAYACNGDSSYAFYTAGDLSFYVSDGLPGNFSPSPPATIDLWDGNWHHLAGSYDGMSVRLYVDGIEQDTGNPAAIAALNYALPDNRTLRIGGYASSCNSFVFNGDIDEVQVFGRALSASEIQAIYTAIP